MESSDERATAHLIAERTLALAEAPGSEKPGRGRYVLLALLVLTLAGVLVALVWPRPAGGPGAEPPGTAGAKDPGEDLGREAGILNCNAWPTATVLLDGRRRLGTTPLHGVRVAQGTHVLAFVSQDGLLRKEVQVTIAAGETRTLAVSLDR